MRLRRVLVWCAAAALLGGGWWYSRRELIAIDHAPAQFARRFGDFTANVNGHVAWPTRAVRSSLNGGPWRAELDIGRRTEGGAFLVELAAAELVAGGNTLALEADALLRTRRVELHFDYDPAPIALPLHGEWQVGSEAALDVQDGAWEVFAGEGGARARPIPGRESYDRILAVCGAFPGGRRVATDVVFRADCGKGRYFGFGLMALWGGRPDRDAHRPRRGWNIAIQWYYNRYESYGCEFSITDDGTPRFTVAYRNVDLAPGAHFSVVAECVPVLDADGHHAGYRQRMKWWPFGTPEPPEWLVLDDTLCPLPAGEYSVALMAHRCQVDFGPVDVTPLPALGEGAPWR